MKLLLLFALFACSLTAFGMTPSHAQIAMAPMTRVVRPDTPANRQLVAAVLASDLPGAQAALEAGASADARTGWQGQPELTSVTVLAAEVPLVKPEKLLPIFRLLIQNVPAVSIADPKQGGELLYAAVGLNDLESIRQLAASGGGMNPPHPGGAGILQESIERDGVQTRTLSPITAFLLNHGAQVNATDADGRTALMAAAQYDKVAAVQMLLANGADPTLRDKHGWTALNWASLRGLDDVIVLLRNRSPMDIYEAAQFGDVPRLKAHLDAGEDPNAPGLRGTTPLMEAIKSGSLPAARLLLDHGADVNQKRPDGTTALHLAALYGAAPLAGLLLDRGADINASGKPERPATPLTYAVRQAQVEVVAMLLKRGADLKHGQGEAALELAVREVGDGFVRPPMGQPRSRLRQGDAVYDARGQIIDLLLAGGVPIRSKSSHALFLAANGGQAGLVKLFLDKGADVNERGAIGATGMSSLDNGETVLMGAVEAWSSAYYDEVMLKNGTMSGSNLKDIHQNEQLARQSVMLLLTHGADVNLPDVRGTTPLMLCVTYELPTLANLLLADGAKVDTVNPAGQTALMQATSAGNYAVAALLLAHHANVNRRDKLGQTPLMLTIDDGTNAEYRARPAEPWSGFDDNGRPISSAEKQRPVLQKDLPNPDGHPKIVHLLLLHGASVNAVAHDGSTALSLARKENFASVITMLQNAGARRHITGMRRRR